MKRCAFFLQEETLIIDLHAILGNRTDNKIKNLWNSCLKKKLRQRGIDPDTHKPLSSDPIKASLDTHPTGKQQQSSLFDAENKQQSNTREFFLDSFVVNANTKTASSTVTVAATAAGCKPAADVLGYFYALQRSYFCAPLPPYRPFNGANTSFTELDGPLKVTAHAPNLEKVIVLTAFV
uniref:HTH myb-type domain-containing protein n=1 Tax=Kalanchoe fedtschenkoi TaxID=63787 RepID=A0A7N0UCI1_KALFE